MVANWKLFRRWEIEERKSYLDGLSSQKALRIYEELYLLRETLPAAELKQVYQRRLKNLIGWRKRMDSLKKELL